MLKDWLKCTSQKVITGDRNGVICVISYPDEDGFTQISGADPCYILIETLVTPPVFLSSSRAVKRSSLLVLSGKLKRTSSILFWRAVKMICETASWFAASMRWRSARPKSWVLIER